MRPLPLRAPSIYTNSKPLAVANSPSSAASGIARVLSPPNFDLSEHALGPRHGEVTATSCAVTHIASPTADSFGLFERISDHLFSPNSDSQGARWSAVRCFTGVSLHDFQTLAHRLEETDLLGKPKLSYLPKLDEMIVQWPLAAHEFCLTEVRVAISPIAKQLSNSFVRTKVETNITIQGGASDFSGVSDLSLVVSTLTGPTKIRVCAIVECAFSQDVGALEKKIRSMLDVQPDIVMVIAIVIEEAMPYESPKEGSEAWEKFAKEDDCRGVDGFMGLRYDETDSSGPFALMPFTVAQHKWCDIAFVEYQVWIQGDDGEKIDIDRATATFGTLYPEIRMGNVELAIRQGLLRVRESITQFIREFRPNATSQGLLPLVDIPATLAFDWIEIQRALRPAADLTAAQRYQDWYKAVFRGTKRFRSGDDEFQADNTTESDDSPPSTSRTRRRRGGKHKDSRSARSVSRA